MNQNNWQKWPQNATVYHIYPLSFKDANGDGYGDLNGIIEKLDYVKELGVNTVWLSPVYKSPMVDFGYDVSDYYDIDPLFGNLEIFDDFIKKAHKKGIKIIMDFVPNHTSSQHPWFLESRSSKNNPKRDWYVWKDPVFSGHSKKETPPNNWLSVFGGSAWAHDSHTGQYYLHNYFEEQPDLNWSNKEVKMEMGKIMEFWLKRGVDGFRIDAVDHLIESRNFKNDPKNPDYGAAGKDDPYNAYLHVNSQKREERFEIINFFCKIASKYGNKLLLSETYARPEELAKFYQICSECFHAPLIMNLISLEWKAASYKNFLNETKEKIGENNLLNYVLGNHDRGRVVSRLGQDRARTLAFLIFTLKGIPFVYYGEEIGMENSSISSVSTRDQLGKRVPGFNLGRDPQRSPMQWSNEKYAGFSDVKPWLPISKKYKKINVKTEQKEDLSMLNFYRNMIKLKKESKALSLGSCRPIDLEDGGGDILAFERNFRKEKILVLVNFSDIKKTIIGKTDGTIVYSSLFGMIGEKINIGKIILNPNEGLAIKIKNN